jgi:type II secretory pathway pseudopilin PulG
MRQNSGHSLLEMILAAMIFSTVAVGILGIWVMQHKAVSKAGHVLVAQYFGEQLMEECIAARYDAVDTMDSDVNPVQPLDLDEVEKGMTRTIRYEAVIDVQDIQVQSGINDTKLVTVTVTWDGNDGRSQIDFRTYLQEKG